jgi:hypothetical protein
MRHGLQAESSVDSGRLSSQHFSNGPAGFHYLSHGSSLQDTSDSSASSRFSSCRSFLTDKDLYELQLYNKELEQKNAILETQCTTLQYVSSILHICHVSGGNRHAYDSLLDTLQTYKSKTPCSTDATAAPIRSDYPLIKFWTKQEWMEYCNNDITSTDKMRGKSRAAQGVNITMRFAELEDGTVVDGHVAGNIRRCARSAWVYLANTGEAPSKLRSASMSVIRSYHEEMYRRFPYLQYCDDDWKAEQIAMDNYPSWYNSWSKKTNAARASANIKDEQELPLVLTKRPNDATLDTETKRMKITPQPANVTKQIDHTPARSVAASSSDSSFMVWISFTSTSTLHD